MPAPAKWSELVMIKIEKIFTEDIVAELNKFCWHTGVPITEDNSIIASSFVPGVKSKWRIANTPEAKEHHRKSAIAFHESEANCNTCKFLERVPHPKNSGFLYGKCSNSNKQVERSPYYKSMNGDIMMFHPDDWMGMPCYASRWD